MRNKLVLLAVLALLTISTVVFALPSGPTGPIVPIKSERWPTWSGQVVDAIAGNVTEFNTNTSTITRTWQGYFGNITGTITLGDASNKTLYDWSQSSPQGQIYAVRNAATPTWSSVVCASQAQLQAEDVALGVNESHNEVDAVNVTFVVGGAPDQIARFGSSQLTYPAFWVGSTQINANACPVAVMYNSTHQPSPYFKEVMLSDGSANLIYTGIIAHTLNPYAESDGFDARTHDFEMIVGENGHGTDTAVSQYYFYLELQ